MFGFVRPLQLCWEPDLPLLTWQRLGEVFPSEAPAPRLSHPVCSLRAQLGIAWLGKKQFCTAGLRPQQKRCSRQNTHKGGVLEAGQGKLLPWNRQNVGGIGSVLSQAVPGTVGQEGAGSLPPGLDPMGSGTTGRDRDALPARLTSVCSLPEQGGV